MKVLIVGLGSMGRRHAANAHRMGHDVHCQDDDPSAFEHCRWTWHESLGAALRLKPEAVVIATPAATHADLLSQCDRSKLTRLFVEKPLGVSRVDMVRSGLLQADQRPVAVGYQLRFHPHVRALKRLVGEMRAGKGVATLVAWQADAGHAWPGTAYADALLECSHEIDLALDLLGPAKVAYAAHSDDAKTWDLALLHDGGIMSKIHLSTAAARYDRWVAVVGNDGRYCWWGWHGPSGRSVLIRPDKSEDTLSDTTHEAYYVEIGAFLGDAWTGCDLAGGLAVLAVCDRARELAALGASVE